MSRSFAHGARVACGARSALFALLALAAFPTGCMVGPDFQRPDVESPPAWQGLEAQEAPAAPPSAAVQGAASLAHWWTAFDDHVLTELIERAAMSNLDLVAAEARLRAARARRGIAVGGLFPSVDVFASAAHAPQFSDADGVFSDNANLFAAGFDATWELDIFGRVRRGIEATDAGIESAVQDQRDVWVSLAAEVASVYTQLRASQEQLRTVQANLTAQKDTQRLTQSLYEAGIVGALDVANSTAQVEATTSRLPVYVSAVRESIYTLSVLVGREPGALLAQLMPTAPIPVPPAQIPVGLPSDLLLRRPDIRRAEAELHASTARVGVAVADQFPRVTLSAALGVQNSDFSNFVSMATRYWSVGAGAVMPIFEGGKIQSNIALQRAATDEALAAYRKQVLVAFKEVEVALVRFAQEQERRSALGRTVDASKDAVSLSTELYTAGKTDFLNVLAAQRALLEAQEALAASDRAVTDHLIALYKALGGGWEGTVMAITAQE